MEAEPTGARRRVVLAAGAGVAAGAAAALTGCQVYGRQEPPAPPPPPPAGGDGEDGGGSVAAVASTGDVAVGGGLILTEQNLVITQPEEGEFKGFSATCTHQGCTVSEVTDGVIICNCHNSQFSIVDGSVVQAAQGLTPDQQAPLPAAGIAVEGDAITLA